MKTLQRRNTGKRVVKEVRTVYTAAHLKRYYPRAFERALQTYREEMDLSYTSDEMMDSLKGLCEAAGVKIRDYSLGAYNRENRLYVQLPGEEETADLTGPRALAWIENNIKAKFRAPWGLPSPRQFDKKYVNGTHNTVYNTDEKGRPVSRWTRPGAVKECPFTGVCYDEDFLEELEKSVLRGGRTLKEAFEDLADHFALVLETEYEYQGEPAQFIEAAEANAWEFDKGGRMV